MSDDFAHAVARKLCLQLCSLGGYGAASDTALDILSDLVKNFIRQSTVTARSYAETSGRTEINAQDIAASLDELGFPLEDLKAFEESTGEVPFVASVPKFPLRPRTEDYNSFKMNKQKPPEHIPNYLPMFPAEHTYRQTPMFLNKRQDEKTRTIRAHEVKRTTEDVLMKIGNKDDQGNPYLSDLLVEDEGMTVTDGTSHQTKKAKKMASHWTELLLGRLQQTDEATDMSARLLPTTSLSSMPSFESQDLLQLKKRKKDRDAGPSKKEKKSKSNATNQFTAKLKFNLQPTTTTTDRTSGDSIQDNPSEEQSTSQGIEPLPIIHEESCLESEDIDIFGIGPFPQTTEDVDSNDIPGDGSSAPDVTPIQPSVREEPRETSPKSEV